MAESKDLFGPRATRPGTLVNPAKADGGDALMPLVMMIVRYLLPLVIGGGLGALEGAARKGNAGWWKGIDDYVKAAVLTVIAGVAEFVLESNDDLDAEMRSMLDRLYGSAATLAAMYGAQKVMGDHNISHNPAGEDVKGLGGLGALALAEKDARDAEAAVREMVRRRADWARQAVDTRPYTDHLDLGELPLEGDGLGELVFDQPPRISLR